MYGNMALGSMALLVSQFAPHRQVRDEYAQDHDNHNMPGSKDMYS